jgi:hypothetical protein
MIPERIMGLLFYEVSKKFLLGIFSVYLQVFEMRHIFLYIFLAFYLNK